MRKCSRLRQTTSVIGNSQTSRKDLCEIIVIILLQHTLRDINVKTCENIYGKMHVQKIPSVQV